MENMYYSMESVKGAYDFLEAVRSNLRYGMGYDAHVAIALHDKRGCVGGKLYFKRWGNGMFADWYNSDSEDIDEDDFWKLCDDYTVCGIEPNAKRDGDYCHIIHCYKVGD